MSGFSAGQITANLRGAAQKQRKATALGLADATEHVLGVARTRVPIEEATLERSGTASVDETNLTGAVSFDTEYAVTQHESLDFKHDAGRQAKYLETAFASERDICTRLIADRIRESF